MQQQSWTFGLNTGIAETRGALRFIGLNVLSFHDSLFTRYLLGIYYNGRFWLRQQGVKMIEWFLLSHSVRMEKRARHVKYVKTQRDKKKPRVDSISPWLDRRWHCYTEHGLQPGSTCLASGGPYVQFPALKKQTKPNKNTPPKQTRKQHHQQNNVVSQALIWTYLITNYALGAQQPLL